MISKIVRAKIGSSIAKKVTGSDSTTTALIGAAIPFVISRMSFPSMIVLGAGGYVAKRIYDKRKDAKSKGGNAGGEAKVDQAATRPNGAAVIANQPLPAGIS